LATRADAAIGCQKKELKSTESCCYTFLNIKESTVSKALARRKNDVASRKTNPNEWLYSRLVEVMKVVQSFYKRRCGVL